MLEDYSQYATQSSNFDQTMLHVFWTVCEELTRTVLGESRVEY